MRRTLSVNVPRCVSYLFNPVPAARTAERVRGFPVNVLRTLVTKPPNMDLSNMRKKYKGDEEVSRRLSNRRFTCGEVYYITTDDGPYGLAVDLRGQTCPLLPVLYICSYLYLR